MRLFLTIIIFLSFISTGAQTLVKVRDKSTLEPIPYASILIQDPQKRSKEVLVTNEKGELHLSLKSSSIVLVSSNGYISRSDTIISGPTHDILLSPSNLQLEDIVVTASAKPISRDKSIYKIDMISTAQIKERGSINLEDLLQNQVNVRVEQNGSLGSSIRMQGLSSNEIKILVDGVPVIGRVNGNLDISQINLQNVDHVEIIEGPMAVIYGSDAVGGLINVITKENNKQSLNFGSSLYYETAGKYNVNLFGSYHKNRQTLSLMLSRNFFQGVALPIDTIRTKSWRPYLQYNVDGSYIYAIQHHRIKLSSSYFYEDYFIPGSPRSDLDTALSKGGQYYLKSYAYDAYNFTTRFNNTLDYTFSRNNYTVNLVGAYSTFQRILNTYYNDLSYLMKTTKGVANQDTQKQKSVMIRSIWSNTSIEHFQFTGGADFNYEYAVAPSDFSGTKDISDIAAFLNMQYSPIQSLSIQPGARIMHNSIFLSPLIYSLNLKYAISDFLSLRASFAKGYRAPELKELYFNFTALGHEVHGNPNLKPENSNNVNFALNYKLIKDQKHINFGLTGFFNQIKDKIDYLVYPDNPLKADYINLSEALYKNFGSNVDFTWQFKTIFTFNVAGGFTAVSTLKNSNSFFYSPNYAGNLSFLQEQTQIRLSINYKYYGKFIQYTAEKQSGTDLLNVTSEGIAGGYHNLDIQLSREFLNKKIDLAIGAKNLFNNTSVTVNNAAQSNIGLIGYGRSAYVRLNFNLEKL